MRVKKTSVVLLVLAVFFVMTIIILCLYPQTANNPEKYFEKLMAQEYTTPLWTHEVSSTSDKKLLSNFTPSEKNSTSTHHSFATATFRTSHLHFPESYVTSSGSTGNSSASAGSPGLSNSSTLYLNLSTSSSSTTVPTSPSGVRESLRDGERTTAEEPWMDGNETDVPGDVNKTTPEETLQTGTHMNGQSKTTTLKTTPSTPYPRMTLYYGESERTQSTTGRITGLPSTAPPSSTRTSYRATPITYQRYGVHPYEERFCLTRPCKTRASEMLSMIDHEVEPCQDFYKYACGNAEKNHHIDLNPEVEINRRIRGQLESVEEKDISGHAKLLYKSCIVSKHQVLNEELLSGARKRAREFGDLIPSGTAVTDTMPLHQYLANFSIYDFFPFIEAAVEAKGGEEKFVPVLRLASEVHHFGRPERKEFCLEKYYDVLNIALKSSQLLDFASLYEEYENCSTSYEAVHHQVKHLGKVAKALDLFDHIPTAQREEAFHQILNETTEILLQLGEHIMDEISKRELVRDVTKKEFESHSASELDNDHYADDMMVFDEYIKLFGESVTSDTKINVYHWSAMRSILHEFHTIWTEQDGKRKVSNMLLLLWAGYVYSQTVQITRQSDTPQGVKDSCTTVVKHLLPEVAGILFLESFVDAERAKRQNEVKKMAEEIRAQMIRLMGSGTSETYKLSHKLRRLNFEIGKGDDENNFDLKDLDLQIDLHENHLTENVFKLLKRKRNRLYKLLNQRPSSTMALWKGYLFPFEYSAYTVHELNKILLPYSLLNSPFYYKKQDIKMAYLNYAGLGNIITQELFKSIGETGIMFNDIGSHLQSAYAAPVPLIQKSEEVSSMLQMTFTDTIKIHDASYNITYKLPNKLHLDDFMSRLGGIRLSWLSYLSKIDNASSHALSQDLSLPLVWLGKTQLSPNKAFFLHYAQLQCRNDPTPDLLQMMESPVTPPKLRVNLLFRSEPFFHEAFNCSGGSSVRGSASPYDLAALRYAPKKKTSSKTNLFKMPKLPNMFEIFSKLNTNPGS